jgi:hypothetical protein
MITIGIYVHLSSLRSVHLSDTRHVRVIKQPNDHVIIVTNDDERTVVLFCSIVENRHAKRRARLVFLTEQEYTMYSKL